MEERRAQKKLAKTRSKADEILELKKRNYQKLKRREEVTLIFNISDSLGEKKKIRGNNDVKIEKSSL